MDSKSNTEDFTSLEHRYLDERFSSLEKMITTSISNQEKLSALAKDAADKALEKAEWLAAHNQQISNEFRGQLKDQAERLITRTEAITRFDTVDEKIAGLSKDIAELREFRSTYAGSISQRGESRTNNQWIIGICIALAGLVIAFAVYVKEDKSNTNGNYQQPFSQTTSTTTETLKK